MTRAPDDAVFVTATSSTAGRHMARRLKSRNGGDIVTFGDDVRCTGATGSKESGARFSDRSGQVLTQFRHHAKFFTTSCTVLNGAR
jgi:hypothetical protein